jgi:TolA-binding protein
MEKTLSFGLLLCVASAVFIVAGVRARELDADRVYQAGQRDMDQGRTARARARFAQARDLAPLSNTAIHSLYFEAIILYREERWREASEAFQQLLARFPEAHAAAESSYHVGLCAERLEELREAVRLFAETRDRYPGTRWADLSAQRLRNLTVNP